MANSKSINTCAFCDQPYCQECSDAEAPFQYCSKTCQQDMSGPMICEHCKREDETTVERVNPYMLDVKNLTFVEAICDTCYKQLKDDI